MVDRWLQEEVDYLQENSSLSIGELSRKLGRSTHAVKFKASKLAVSLGRGNPAGWSWAEDLRLRAFAKSGDKFLSDLIGRSIGAVRYRAASENISLRKRDSVMDNFEESAAIMQHDGGWPKEAAEAMSVACQYMFNRDAMHKNFLARDYLRGCSDELAGLFDEDDPLGTQVALAQHAFYAVGTPDDVDKLDRDLAKRFELQAQMWRRAKTEEEREEHAGGMTRGYLMLIERILGDG